MSDLCIYMIRETAMSNLNQLDSNINIKCKFLIDGCTCIFWLLWICEEASTFCSSELYSFPQDKEPEYVDFSQEDYEDPIMNKLLQTEGHWLTTVRNISCQV